MNTKSVLALTVVILAALVVWLVIGRGDNKDVLTVVEDDKNQSQQNNDQGSVTNSPQTITMDNGLKIQDVQVGTGKEAKVGSVITAHYTGYLENGTVFDSSVSRGQPFSFTLGRGEVIRGWDIGIQGMKEGGKRRLIIPSTLAYGQAGIEGAIPPNATLVFDVELLKVGE